MERMHRGRKDRKVLTHRDVTRDDVRRTSGRRRPSDKIVISPTRRIIIQIFLRRMSEVSRYL